MTTTTLDDWLSRPAARTSILAAALLAVLGIGVVDRFTHLAGTVTLLYVVPVLVVAWYGGTTPGVLTAVTATAADHIVWLLETPDAARTTSSIHFSVTLAAFLTITALVVRCRERVALERRRARRDPLTGALTRGGFYEEAPAVWTADRRRGRTTAALFIDLDGLKEMNDCHGHPAGDDLIRRFADVTREELRLADADGTLFARVGGDEFVVLMSNMDMAEATAFSERLLDALTASGGIAVSIGLATSDDGSRVSDDGPDGLLSRADAAMYEAKRAGGTTVRRGHTIAAPSPRIRSTLVPRT